MSTLPADGPQTPAGNSGWRILFKVSLLVIVPFIGLYLLRLALVAMGVIDR